MMHLQLARAYGRYKKWYRRICKQRDMLRRAACRLRSRGLSAAYFKWCQWYYEIIESHAVALKAADNFVNRAVLGAFNRWSEWYEDMLSQLAHSREAAGAFRNRFLKQGWNSWAGWFADLMHQKALVTLSVQRHFMKAISTAFGQWRWVAAEMSWAIEERERLAWWKKLASHSDSEEEIRMPDMAALGVRDNFPVDPANRDALSSLAFTARSRALRSVISTRQDSGLPIQKYLCWVRRMHRGEVDGGLARSMRGGATVENEMSVTEHHLTAETALFGRVGFYNEALPMQTVLTDFCMDSARVKRAEKRWDRYRNNVRARAFSTWVHNDFAGFHAWARGSQCDNKVLERDDSVYPDHIGWGHREWEESAFPVGHLDLPQKELEKEGVDSREENQAGGEETTGSGKQLQHSAPREGSGEIIVRPVQSNRGCRRSVDKDRAGFTDGSTYRCLGGDYVALLK